jgi:hypothetical protein
MAEGADRVDTFLLGWGQFILPLVLSSAGSTQPLTFVLATLEGHHLVPYSIINAAAIVAIAIPAVRIRGGSWKALSRATSIMTGLFPVCAGRVRKGNLPFLLKF